MFYSKPHSLLSLWKNALELFVWNKSLINSKHEFAIVLLEDKEAIWVCVAMNVVFLFIVK